MRAQTEHPQAAALAEKIAGANRDDAEDLVCAALASVGMTRVAEAWVGPERMRAQHDGDGIAARGAGERPTNEAGD